MPLIPLGVLGLLVLAVASCASPAERTVRQFRAALEKNDHETAARYLAEDPRLWWEEREGEGSPCQLGRGEWAAWDEHFRGKGRPVRWEVGDDAVSIVMEESNDYYRLTERGPQQHRRTYFIDDEGKIEGTMISAAVPGVKRDPGRGEEFDRWLREHDPEEYEYLRPGGRIDPTGDRAPRTRKALEEWRRRVGLDPIGFQE